MPLLRPAAGSLGRDDSRTSWSRLAGWTVLHIVAHSPNREREGGRGREGGGRREGGRGRKGKGSNEKEEEQKEGGRGRE